ncbi:hypothetical protein J7T55_005574 [Diaporthe amygdali]|uniref:uncharacterized protein n=1 Tax=Phomopsis amygdali TaxID=1214568 RepID=UPI0022FE77F7|nr:uncharacterized protein J7T55_005574 [Diaporthe amygdali]KAJ0124236.1 hypothetical protein J7T55_005574 [Diaporthe amygdali]
MQTQDRATMIYDGDELALTHSRDIRLLKLEWIDEDELLHCHLRVANLDERPVYRSISYTWGPSTQTKLRRHDDTPENEKYLHRIICNGQTLDVTQNLYDCLYQLCDLRAMHPISSFEFWIDAVCINQSDLNERAQQVSMMSNTYHQAEEVIIWLGIRDDSTPLAYKATSEFLATQVSRKMLKSWVDEDFDIDKAALKTAAKLEAVKRDVRNKHPSILLRTLIRCRDTGCKEDKDKIFSVLGMYQLVTQTRLQSNDRLYPDYGLDTAEIYTNAAIEILKQETDLTLLTVAEGEDFCDRVKLPNLPSWIPDWTFATRKTSLGLGITGYERFNASKGLNCEVAFSHDNKVLFVKAARLDGIVRVGETKESVGNGESFDKWLKLLEAPEIQHHTPKGRQDAFWRTLITNTDTMGRCPAPPKLQAGFLQWITRKGANVDHGLSHRVAQSFPRERNAQGIVTLQHISPREMRESLEGFELQYAHSLHQRPFLTSRGYLGLGSQSMKIEVCEGRDREYSVWIVCGSRVPLIFKDTDRPGRYNLVGGAYVHEIMGGEALRQNLCFETIGLE